LNTTSSYRLKYYPLGFGRNVSRSNLVTAYEIRDYRMFEELAFEMIATARSCYIVHSNIIRIFELDKPIL